MKKFDITFRHDCRSGQVPAINVKCYHFGPSVEACMARFNCDRTVAEKAFGYAWQDAQETFWRDAESLVSDVFPGAECYSDGRSAGWLTVHGLPDAETWDAVMLAKWAKLERLVAAEIKYLKSDEQVFKTIESNEWAKPGAEYYNFVDTRDGPRCIADMKAEATAAGYGAVVR